MAIYQSKRTNIWAEKFDPDDSAALEACKHFVGDWQLREPVTADQTPWELWIEKSQFWFTLDKPIFIMKEPDGSGFYPCEVEIFDARWEPKPIVTHND